MPRSNNIQIDEGVAMQLRTFVFEKYGTLYGKIKSETEYAILNHIRGGNDGPRI